MQRVKGDSCGKSLQNDFAPQSVAWSNPKRKNAGTSFGKKSLTNKQEVYIIR